MQLTHELLIKVEKIDNPNKVDIFCFGIKSIICLSENEFENT